MSERLKIFITIIFLWHSLPTIESRGDITSPEAVRFSLIFVFDITGSMRTELEDVKRGATKILQKVNENLQENEDEMIDEYILVPFDDPDVLKVTKTANITLFNRTLNELKVNATPGVGCAEPSLQAIKKGLTEGMKLSLLLVFTDADPRDNQLLPDILSLISEKRTKVVFVLSDTCSRPNSISKQFRLIASHSNGQIFEAWDLNFSKVLEFIHFEVRPRSVDLVAVDIDKPENITERKFDVPVDNTITELILSIITKVSGQFRVINPEGSKFNDFSFCNRSLNLANTIMCSVQNPVIGKWTLLLETNSSFSLRIFGSSNITMNFAFEVFQPNRTTGINNTNKVLSHPMAGMENIFLMKLGDKSGVESLNFGEIISLKGEELGRFPLQAVLGSAGSFFGWFVPANTTYHIRISGKTKSGQQFQRITSVAFSNSTNNNITSASYVAGNIDFVPEELLNWSSLLNKKLPYNCWYVNFAFVWRVIFGPVNEHLTKLLFFLDCF